MKTFIASAAGFALAAIAGAAGAQTLPALSGLPNVAAVNLGNGGLAQAPTTTIATGSGQPLVVVAALSPGPVPALHDGSALSVNALNTGRLLNVNAGPQSGQSAPAISISNPTGRPVLSGLTGISGLLRR